MFQVNTFSAFIILPFRSSGPSSDYMAENLSIYDLFWWNFTVGETRSDRGEIEHVFLSENLSKTVCMDRLKQSIQLVHLESKTRRKVFIHLNDKILKKKKLKNIQIKAIDKPYFWTQHNITCFIVHFTINLVHERFPTGDKARSSARAGTLRVASTPAQANGLSRLISGWATRHRLRITC